jgi:hypothetical protein
MAVVLNGLPRQARFAKDLNDLSEGSCPLGMSFLAAVPSFDCSSSSLSVDSLICPPAPGDCVTSSSACSGECWEDWCTFGKLPLVSFSPPNPSLGDSSNQRGRFNE